MKIEIIIIICIVLFLLICYYLYNENTNLQVTKFKIKNKNFNSFKIGHISDFHNTKSNRLKNNIIKNLKNEKPNIIVITGDFFDSRRTNVDICKDFIIKIKDICPVYYVPGNHESRKKEYEKLKEILIKNKIIVLENICKEIKYNNKIINMIGMIDPGFSSHGKDELNYKIANDYLDSVNYNKNNYSILLSHRPELFDTYVSKKFNLVLCGHVHGGQIRLPFIGGLVAPSQGLFPKYNEGVFKKDNTTMIISRGIGNSLAPFRINNNPELVIIEFE